MNETMEQFARNKILEGLSVLESRHHLLFRRMYSHDDLNRSLEEVVRRIPLDRLSLALTQIENTAKK